MAGLGPAIHVFNERNTWSTTIKLTGRHNAQTT
jgi:hypothetical protein